MTVPKLAHGAVTLSLHEMLARQPLRAAAGEEDAASSAPRKSFHPHHSQSVPRPEDLEAQATEQAARGRSITTMMLRNIPNKYTQNTLLQEIDELGFQSTYDFFYLPMDMHNRSNVGYAFINFVTPAHAERFRRIFSDHRFQRFQSRKISSVCVAHVQGLNENLRHFENRAVTHARNDQYRPIVLRGNRRIHFDDAVGELNTAVPRSDMQQTLPVTPIMRPTEAPEAALRSMVLQAEANGGSARQGLEDAIRNLIGVLSPGHVGAEKAPPTPPGPQPCRAAGQADWSGPAYVPLPASSKVWGYGPECSLAHEEWGDRKTPRTNALILGSTLDKFVLDVL